MSGSLDSVSGFNAMPIPADGRPDDPSGSTELGQFAASATQQHALGRKYETWDGRVFRYIKNGATQLEVALLTQSEAPASQLLDEVQTGYTTAIGDTVITCLVTTGNGITDGELKDGTLIVNKVTGLGYTYRIANNRWITSDTVLELTLKDPILIATAAASEFSILKNLYQDVIVAPTTLTGTLLGVPRNVIPANYYGWIQTKGLCPLYVDTATTLVIGEAAAYKSAGTTVAGAIDLQAATDPIVGRVVTIGAADEIALIDLQLE